MGVNTTSILTSLGVVGLSLGFTAQDTLSNMISKPFVFWDHPFVLGDLIEVGGHYARVDRITMYSSRVVVTALNDDNIATDFQAWISDEKQHIAVRHRLRELLFETLRSAVVDMPLQALALQTIEGSSALSSKTH